MSLLHRYQLLRYAIVGGSVAVFYVVLYAILMQLGVTQVVANALAFAAAIVVQYLGQAVFTFRRDWAEPGQALRFAVMIGVGFVASAVITGMVGPAFGMPPWTAAAIAAIWLPIQNFIFMKLWVFAAPTIGQEQL